MGRVRLMGTWWARLCGSSGPGDAPSGSGSAYAASWDHLARHDALNAICDAADAERFEAYGREHAAQLRAIVRPEWQRLPRPARVPAGSAAGRPRVVNFPNLLAERYTKAFHEYAFDRERAAHRVRPYTPEEVRWF